MGGTVVYKVLIIDSNQRSMEKLHHMLEWDQFGFSLEGYASGPEEASALLDKQPFSLVLISMKEQTDGLDLCDQIRKNSRVPIILIGGSKDFQLARRALYYQVSDYLPDPVSPGELITSLQTVRRKLDYTSTNNQMLSFLISDKEPQAPANIIDKVKEYVEEALHQNITLKEISSVLHYNSSYLGQKFKYQENMTFNEYLLQQRMEKAKILLENTDMRIYEIANEVGYTEIDWFYKKFKSYTGTSANEYRRLISVTA